MVKKSKKIEKTLKIKKHKLKDKKESKQEKYKKNSTIKKLHFMAIHYDTEKNNRPFSEYLELKRKDQKINQLFIDAKLDIDSIDSLTNFLEDNDFSEKNLSDNSDYQEYSINKKNEKTTEKEKFEKFDKHKPLKGKIIVLSGEMLISKEYLKKLLEKLGAKVTTCISNKTDFLIHGKNLEDGRKYFEGKKYKMNKEKNIKIYLDKFFKYIKQLIKKEWKMKIESKKIML